MEHLRFKTASSLIYGVTTLPFGRLMAQARQPLYRNAFAWMVSTSISSALGIIYWIIAAHFYTTEMVGVSAAIVSIMFFVTGVSQLSLSTLLIRFIPNAGEKTGRLVVYSYALSILISGALSVLTVIVLRAWPNELDIFEGNSSFAIWFIISTIFWVIFTLQDSVLTGLRDAIWVPVENIGHAVAKIVLLILFARSIPQYGIFASWVIPAAVLVVPINLLIFRRLIPRHIHTNRAHALPIIPNQLAKYALGSFAGSLFLLASIRLLPVIVTQHEGAQAGAYFFIAWSIASSLKLILTNMTMSLTVEGARDQSNLTRRSMRFLVGVAGLFIPVIIVLFIGAPYILQLSGKNYSTEGTQLLRLLALSIIPSLVTAIYISIAQIKRRMLAVAVVQGILSILVLGLSFVFLEITDITGVGVAFLIGETVIATALVLGYVWHIAFHSLRRFANQRILAVRLWIRNGLYPNSSGTLNYEISTNQFRALLGRMPQLGTILLPLLAASMWLISLKDIDIYRMTDFGLVSVLPKLIFVALGILVVSFCWFLYQNQINTPVLLLHYVVLILILYGTANLLSQAPHNHVTWRHAGFTEYLMRGNPLDGKLEFYFNFPGFFLLNAFATSIAGLRNVVFYMDLAPLFFNLLFLGPLTMILRSGTVNKRLVALGIWIFYLVNWVGQDFYVPQAMGFFLYLTILGILLLWFKATTSPSSPFTKLIRRVINRAPFLSRISNQLIFSDTNSQPSRTWQRVGLLSILFILTLAAVASHPLSPWFLLLTVTALVIFNLVKPRSLPIFLGVLIVAWLSFMAVAYIKSSHAGQVIGEVGNISESINENLVSRIRGDFDHLFVVGIRLLTTGGVWGLALLGIIRGLRRGNWYPSFIVLAGVPFALVALQPYGGEMLLRVFLFTLPAMAFFASLSFYPASGSNTTWTTTLLIGLLSSLFIAVFFFARYGNERIDTFTLNEYQAVQYLYDTSEPGSVYVAVTQDLPWKFQDYEKYTYLIMRRQAKAGAVDAFVHTMENPEYKNAYLILTRTQRIYAETFLGWDPTTWDSFEQKLVATNRFKLIYSNQDAKIYELIKP